MIFKLDPPRTHAEAAEVRRREAESRHDTTDDSADACRRLAGADALIASTARQWRGDQQVERGTPGNARDVADYASGRVRDLFLAALDQADPARVLEIARHLISCGNPLPTMTCVALGLPAGSSYGAGARAVMAKAAAGR